MESRFELSGDFDEEVLQASHELPVLVDFWAEWCGPCQVLGPTLESMAGEAGGRWRLVKVDTERYRDLAARYAIRSIPAVKLFHAGELLDEFVGALPEPRIRTWLDDALARAGVGGSPDDEKLERASELLQRDPRAALDLAEEATQARSQDLREAILTLGRVLEIVQRDAAEEFGGVPDSRKLYEAAARAFLAGRTGEALEGWIAMLTRNRNFDEDGPRRLLIACFRWLGDENPLTDEYRRKFSAALF